jgi:hypothetical protein
LNTSAPVCRTTLSGAIRHAVAISDAYIARMKWVCMMPLGRPVVPLVYMTVRRSSASTSTSGCAPDAAAISSPKDGACSVEASMKTVSGGCASAGQASLSVAAAAELASSTRGRASASSDATPGASSSGDSGTAAAPILAQAQ